LQGPEKKKTSLPRRRKTIRGKEYLIYLGKGNNHPFSRKGASPDGDNQRVEAARTVASKNLATPAPPPYHPRKKGGRGGGKCIQRKGERAGGHALDENPILKRTSRSLEIGFQRIDREHSFGENTIETPNNEASEKNELAPGDIEEKSDPIANKENPYFLLVKKQEENEVCKSLKKGGPKKKKKKRSGTYKLGCIGEEEVLELTCQEKKKWVCAMAPG